VGCLPYLKTISMYFGNFGVNALSGHIIKAQKLVGFEIKGHNLV
jgi:hypothetical protein